MVWCSDEEVKCCGVLVLKCTAEEVWYDVVVRKCSSVMYW